MILIGRSISKVLSKINKGTKAKPNKQPSTSKPTSKKPTAKSKAKISNLADNLPKKPDDLLKQGWKEVTHSEQAKRGSREFVHSKDRIRIRFDRAEAGKPGWRGKDHYHIHNPDRTSKLDHYLDKNGNPVAKNNKASHIKPSVDPQVKQKFQNLKDLKQSKINPSSSPKSLDQKLGHIKQSTPSTSSKGNNSPSANNSPTPKR